MSLDITQPGIAAILAAQVQTDWNASSGLGKVLNKPILGTQMSVDSGWGTNTATADKTAILIAYTGSGISSGMQTALNTVSAGLGTYLATMDSTITLLVKKVTALQTALAASKLPNA